MDKFPRLTADQRTNLVAYLDGELDDEATRQIERTLAQSPVARNEVETLLRTWEMLDLLPKHNASEEFTDRTLTYISVDEYRQPLFERLWYQRARRGVILAGWAVGLAVAAVLGFLMTNTYRVIPHPTEPLVEELPIIENIEIYSEVDSIQFLKELRKSGLFHEDPERDRR